MSEPSFRDRLRKSRLAQVLVVYLGASWVIVEVAGALQEHLSLPEWLTPVAIVILLVGILVVVATAWVQSHPLTDQREVAGEVPDTWEVGLRELGREIRSGRMPHPTWGRALLGGIFAFWLLFGLAGLFVVVKDGGRSFAPDELVAEEAGVGLAVVPFTVTGAGTEVFREGMATLLPTTLDGVAGLRAIDHRTVMARWRDAVPEDGSPDLRVVLDVGRRAGARYVVVGSAVGTASSVALVADVHDLETGAELGAARVEGHPDSIMTLVDRLSVETVRLVLAGRGEAASGVQHVSSLTTSSLAALLAYLEGETFYRQSDFTGAIEAFERALAADSTFALAALRSSQAYGWGNASAPEYRAHRQQALRFAHRLPARERVLVEAAETVQNPAPEMVPSVRAAVGRYPDDPDLWYALGELAVHVAGGGPRTVEAEAFERAAELDPTFAPYLIHLVEYHLAESDSAEAARWVEREGEVAAGGAVYGAHRQALELIHGSPERRQAVLDTLGTSGIPSGYLLRSLGGPRAFRAAGDVYRALVDRRPREVQWPGELRVALMRQGRLVEAAEAPREPFVPVDQQDEFFLLMRVRMGLAGPETLEAGDWSWGPNAAVRAAITGDGAGLARNREGYLALGDTLARYFPPEFAGQIREFFERDLRDFDAVVLWKSGRPREALEALEANLAGVAPQPASEGLWTIAEIHEELGHRREARDAYLSVRAGPFVTLARLRAARLSEALGELELARKGYEDFLFATRDADPGFRPFREEAEGALARLGG